MAAIFLPAPSATRRAKLAQGRRLRQGPRHAVENLGLNHYNLRAPRGLLEDLRAFYCEVVGLRVGERPPLRSFGYWLYAGGRDVLHLSEAGEDEPRRAHARGTFDHVAFTCTGHAQFEEILRRHGIAYEVASVPQTGLRQIFLDDPAGNGVELNFAAESHGASAAR